MSAEEMAKVRNTMSTTTSSQGGYAVQSSVASELIDLLKSYGYMRKVASQITTAERRPAVLPHLGRHVGNRRVDRAEHHRDGRRPDLRHRGVERVQGQLEDRGRAARAAAGRDHRHPGHGLQAPGRPHRPHQQHELHHRWRLDRPERAWSTAASVGKTGTTGQTLTIIYDDLVDLIDSLDAAYLDVPASTLQMPGIEPGFMMSQTMRRVVRKIKDTSGRPIWTPSYDEGIRRRRPTCCWVIRSTSTTIWRCPRPTPRAWPSATCTAT